MFLFPIAIDLELDSDLITYLLYGLLYDIKHTEIWWADAILTKLKWTELNFKAHSHHHQPLSFSLCVLFSNLALHCS